MKTVAYWTERELMALPLADWDEQIVCYSLVIIPGGGKKSDLHESGYRTMAFIAVDENGVPFKRLSGCSDVLSLDGIGGYGMFRPGGELPKLVPVRAWTMDCLPKSGLLRLICDDGITTGLAVSDFSVYAKPHLSKAEKP